MKVIFTQGDSWVSKAICWATNSNISHVAIEVSGMVFHSNFLGPQLDYSENFFKHSKYIVSYGTDMRVFELIDLLEFYLKRKHRHYDFMLFISLSIYCLFLRLFGKVPKKSVLWRVSGAYLCTEFVEEFLFDEEQSTVPQELIDKLEESGWRRI
jgi:hypothetical protein